MTDHQHDDKSLRQAMDAAAKAMDGAEKTVRTNDTITAPGEYTFAPQASQASPPARSDDERLLDTAQRLLRTKLASLVERGAAFERKRVELTCYYRGEIARLEQEAEDELSQLSRAKERELGGIQRMIDRLKALRDG